MFGWFKPQATRPLDSGFQKVILARFKPATRFDLAPDLTRASAHLWREIFARYPNPPPATLREAQGTNAFFSDTLTLPLIFGQPGFIGLADGKPFLRPKQEILDFFGEWERWILRSYYAATGRLLWTEFKKAQESFINSFPQLILPVQPRRQITQEGKLDPSHAAYGAWQREQLHYANQVQSSQEQHRIAIEHWKAAYQDKRREHMQSWGGWFFNGLEQAFDDKFSPAKDDLTAQNLRDNAARRHTL